jgi:antitoxin component YwqK of YwqJK toxin-antitoxin module
MSTGCSTPRSGRAALHRPAIKIALALSLALLAITAFTARFLLRHPQTEVLPQELVLQDGKLYRKGQNRPFHGWLVEFYPDGTLLSRSAVVDGRLHGLSEGWYSNGQIQIRETYQRGLAHGVRIKWYPDGTTQSVAHLAEGHYHGPYRRWHENGLLAEEVEFQRGHPHGWARSYHPSGALKTEVQLEHGRIVQSTDAPGPSPHTAAMPPSAPSGQTSGVAP